MRISIEHLAGEGEETPSRETLAPAPTGGHVAEDAAIMQGGLVV
jgi:hypothetical protein